MDDKKESSKSLLEKPKRSISFKNTINHESSKSDASNKSYATNSTAKSQATNSNAKYQATNVSAKPNKGPIKEFIIEQIDELFESFSLFDKDYNGAINSKELSDMMKSIGLNATNEEVDDMIEEADTVRFLCIFKIEITPEKFTFD